jgi:hypothetical protein
MSKKDKSIIKIWMAAFLIIIFMGMGVFLVKSTTLGYWERHTYTQTIGVGEGYYHQYYHEGAIDASARLISTTGNVDFYYRWDAPWLRVWITNKDSKSVTVQWEESFYVV